jgi:putative peptide zinc metalloprotease protein
LSEFTADALVAVYPFTRQPSGDEVIIGRQGASAFLVLGQDAVQVLDDLAAGKTLGEAEALYFERHGERPDLGDFLGSLRDKGLVRRLDQADQAVTAPQPEAAAAVSAWRRLLDAVARLLFGRVAVAVWAIAMLAALAVAIREPALIPSRTALFFSHHMTLFSLALLTFSMSTAMVHELAHLLAARAVGVSARIGFSNRLWVLVAETDISGVWAIPKAQRFLPILAGPMADAGSAALLLLGLAAVGQDWRALHPLATHFVQAMVLSYGLRLVWQCYLFVRTDFYYALIMLLDCRDLMRDTANFVNNQVRRLLRRPPKINQSQIPAREQRVIRWFSLPFLAGRIIAFAVLFFVQMPVVVAYFRQVAHNLSAGYQAKGGDFVDSVLLSSIGMSFFFLGMFLWIKGMVRTGRPAHGTADGVA